MSIRFWYLGKADRWKLCHSHREDQYVGEFPSQRAFQVTMQWCNDRLSRHKSTQLGNKRSYTATICVTWLNTWRVVLHHGAASPTILRSHVLFTHTPLSISFIYCFYNLCHYHNPLQPSRIICISVNNIQVVYEPIIKQRSCTTQRLDLCSAFQTTRWLSRSVMACMCIWHLGMYYCISSSSCSDLTWVTLGLNWCKPAKSVDTGKRQHGISTEWQVAYNRKYKSVMSGVYSRNGEGSKNR